jgi:hypothetical protein
MSEPKKDPFTEAVEFLRHDKRFLTILGELAERRERAITKLATYSTDCELRKAAAEVSALTDFLDMFGVPTGTPAPPT